MKLYMLEYDNGTTVVVRTPECANIHATGGNRVYVIDAEEYVPETPELERWAVVDGVTSGHIMKFSDRDDAERLKSALEAGGLSGLSVVNLAKDDAE